MSEAVNEIARVKPDQAPAVAEPQKAPENLLSAIVLMASNPAVDVQKLSAILAMQERLEARQAEAEFNQAMARLQPRVPRIKKNGTVEYPVNKNEPNGPKLRAFSYARWEDVDAGIRSIMNDEGFSLSFNTMLRVGDGGGVVVTGELRHVGGHCKSASFALPLDTSGGKNNLQGYASSTSFGQRYCAKMLLNLVFEGEDDDGRKGGMTFLSTDQVSELVALLAETKTEESRFLAVMCSECHRMEEVEAKDFVRLKNALLSKRKQLQDKGATA